MSDLFSSNSQKRDARVLVTRDLRGQPFVAELRTLGFEIDEYDDARSGKLENSIIACYPGKGRSLDEKLPPSSFLILLDADDALERVMSKRCFFIDSSDSLEAQLGIFEALDDLLFRRKEQSLVAKKTHEWEEKVQEALSGFEYLIKSLPMHRPGEIDQDEGLADLLDFFVRVLVFKERSVSLTSEKKFWESLFTTFSDFNIENVEDGMIPLGRMSINAVEKNPSKYSLLKIMGLAFLVSEFSDQIDVLERQRREENLWEEALSKLPYPVALIAASGDLVAHNAAFAQLSIFPADCLKLRAQQKVETSTGIYRVERNRLEGASSEHEEVIYTFLFRDDGGKRLRSGSGEELGIISSSIAHELNNPLAGILASLTLLELEDNIEPEMAQTISDMKRGAKRCKELIEIFLGFSRANPTLTSNISSGIDAFEKAMSLSRFRMIESNLRLDVESNFVASFHRQTNASILAMVWYLVLGEILTASSHHNLVTGSTGASVKGKFFEREHSLELIIDGVYSWEEAVTKSKLLLHLVELAGLSMVFDAGKLTLRDWTLT